MTKLKLSRWVLLVLAALVVVACSRQATTDTGSTTNDKPGTTTTTTELPPPPPPPTSVSGTPIPTDPGVRMGKLSNGLRYYIRKNETPDNRAELRLAVNAGAMQEDEDQRGLAHFLEHMAFNGTENFKKSELVDYLESVGTRFGADLNAYTSFDETVYMLQVDTEKEGQFDTGMKVLEEWAGRVAFEGDEIDKERGVVISEWRTGQGASARMRKEWFPTVFNDSRYAVRLPIGDTAIIANAPYETVKRFYRDWYRPNLMAVVVVGDVDVDAVENQIKQGFGTLKNPVNPREKKEYDVPSHKETLISIVTDKEAPNSSAFILYKHPAKKTTTTLDYRKEIMSNLYNRMLNERLAEIGRKPDAPFLFANAGYGGIVRTKDAYSANVVTKEGKILDGIEAVLRENQRVLQHGFTMTELERAKEATLKSVERAALEADKTDSRVWAQRYVSNFLEQQPIPSPQQRVELYQQFVPAISIDEVNRLAKEWITPNNRAIVIQGPEKEGLAMPTKAEVRQVLDELSREAIDPYVDNVSNEALFSERLTIRKVTNEKKIESVGVTEITLENGVRVVMKPTDFKNDEILFRAYSRGGSSLYSDEDYPEAAMAAELIDQSGIKNMDITALQKMLSGKKVNVSPFISDMTEGFRGSASPEDLETMLQLTYLYFTKTRKDEEAFQSMVEKRKAQSQMMANAPTGALIDSITYYVTQDDPRARPMKDADYDKLDMDRAYDIYAERFADASDFTFFLVGNFDVEKVKPMVAKYLGNLPAKNRKEMGKDTGERFPEGQTVVRFRKGEAPQSFVVMASEGEFDADDAEARYVFNAMTSVLSRKLREKLREEMSGVYGVQVQPSIEKEPRERYSLSVFFIAKPEQTDELIEAAKGVIENLKSEPIGALDLQKIQETDRTQLAQGLKENSFWAEQLYERYYYGRPIDKISMEEAEQRISALTPQKIQAMAKRILTLDNYVEVVMMSEAAPATDGNK